jgi:hypothetical protein
MGAGVGLLSILPHSRLPYPRSGPLGLESLSCLTQPGARSFIIGCIPMRLHPFDPVLPLMLIECGSPAFLSTRLLVLQSVLLPVLGPGPPVYASTR